jgi:hypothetical protein
MIEMPSDPMLEQIAQVASEEGEPLTSNQVAAFIAAYNNIMSGEPIGTMLKNPETGAVAIRANVDGLHMWRVNAPDGSQWNDLQPTLEGWEKIA